MSEAARAATFVTLTSLGAVTLVLGTACGGICLTLFLQAVLAFSLRVLATVGEIVIAVIAAIVSGFTISLTVVLAASTSAVTFPPSRIESRLIIAVAVATASIATSAGALFSMTSLQVNIELGAAVVTSAAVAVAFASAWAVGVMSLVERETQEVGLKMTSLLQAVRHNKYHVLSLLVRLPLGNQQDESEAALLYAVKAGFVECVQVLISAGANTNIQDAYENTPLISACQLGSVKMVRILLDAGAIVNFRNGNRESALHHSAKWGHEGCTRLLLSNGADASVQDALWRTPLMLAIKHAHEPSNIIHMLLEHGCHVNAIGTEQRTALHYAAFRGLDIKPLLEAGSDREMCDTEGNTALHFAAMEGHCDVLMDLLVVSEDINNFNFIRRTALHLAAAGGSVPCIESLISHSADPFVADKAGHLPINHAVLNKRDNATLYFLERNMFSGTLHDSRQHEVATTPVISPIQPALEKGSFNLARALMLGGCGVVTSTQRHLLDSRKLLQEDYQAAHFVCFKLLLHEPWCLVDLCRRDIRHCLGNPKEQVQRLPLPNQLRNFLLLCDLIDIIFV